MKELSHWRVFMSYFTLKSGEKLYYEDRGQGPDTLIMMHGWTNSHEVYLKPVEMLQKQARCIIFDYRGHSGSKTANSGNPTMETLAADGCSSLKQIILCDMTPKQLNDEEWKLGLYQGRYTKENMERDANKDFYTLYKDFAIGAIPKLGKIPGFLLKRPLKKRLADCDESVLKSLAASMKTQDNRPAVGQITVPVTYFYADPGSLFSPELADWYKEHIAAPYRAVCFRNSTHMLVIDYPEKFAEEVSAVLRS